MPAVTRGRPMALLAAGLAAAAIGSLPAIAAGDTSDPVATSTTTTPTTPAPEPAQLPRPPKPAHGAHPAKPAHLSVHVHGVRHGRVKVGKRARAVGYLRPFVAGQHVRVKLLRKGHVIQKLNPKARRVRGKNAGRYRFRSPALIKPASYRIVAKHLPNGRQRKEVARSPNFRISFPDLDPGDRNSTARIFNHLLHHEGYYSTHGKDYGNRTGLAVMAFRKTNGMKRTVNANPNIFKQLADGRGNFHLKYPGAGKHVEVDISRQVMVLANNGKPQYTIHVSTGAPATPTIRGHFRFYSRQPGFNSSGMYYSVYFRGGYATHGYHSVPTYPASHGCVRNPISQSVFISNWVRLGMSIYVYG
jgi:L,D-transpeptidase-like protein